MSVDSYNIPYFKDYLRELDGEPYGEYILTGNIFIDDKGSLYAEAYSQYYTGVAYSLLPFDDVYDYAELVKQMKKNKLIYIYNLYRNTLYVGNSSNNTNV